LTPPLPLLSPYLLDFLCCRVNTDLTPRLTAGRRAFIVLAQPPVPPQPRERPLDHPPGGEDFKLLALTLHDNHPVFHTGTPLPLPHRAAVILVVGIDLLQAGGRPGRQLAQH